MTFDEHKELDFNSLMNRSRKKKILEQAESIEHKGAYINAVHKFMEALKEANVNGNDVIDKEELTYALTRTMVSTEQHLASAGLSLAVV